MLGLLFALGLNLVLYSTMNLMNAVAIAVDTLANIVRMSLACGVIATVLGRK